MDSYHRQLLRRDSRTGRDCKFCLQFDPEFAKRNPIDRSVQEDQEDSAAAHLSEDGHVRHRIFEIRRMRSKNQHEAETYTRSA
jgi:hypothetical protein